ncbi:MAG: ribosome maturation factor RimM [Synergistetes bacterium]|nr:ribosome maturation factor RimM [Synergistota bacterium]MDW8192314.1 ribosome maturation factor RimM [Synergistota bacterium]
MKKHKLIIVGKVVAAHGIKGVIKVLSMTDFPERLRERKRLIFYDDRDNVLFEGDLEKLTLEGRTFLIKVKGCETRDMAERLIGSFIKVKEEELPPLGEGEFYFHQIIGLKVYTQEGKYLGKIVDILKTGANDVFCVRGEKEYMIPALKSVVREIDLDKEIMIIFPMEGLLE